MLAHQRTSKRFERHIGGVLTPARPTYLYNRVDNRLDGTQDLDAARPILGVASSVSGHKARQPS